MRVSIQFGPRVAIQSIDRRETRNVCLECIDSLQEMSVIVDEETLLDGEAFSIN